MLLKPKATARCLTQETLPMIHTFGYVGYVNRVSYDSRFHDHEAGLFSLVIQHRWIIPVLAWTWSKCGFLMPLKKAVTCAQWHCNPKEDARHVVVQRQDCWEASLEHLVYDVFGPLWRWHTKLTSATSGRVSKDVHRQQKTVGLETVQDLCLCCQSGSSKMHDMTMLAKLDPENPVKLHLSNDNPVAVNKTTTPTAKHGKGAAGKMYVL